MSSDTAVPWSAPALITVLSPFYYGSWSCSCLFQLANKLKNLHETCTFAVLVNALVLVTSSDQFSASY